MWFLGTGARVRASLDANTKQVSWNIEVLNLFFLAPPDRDHAIRRSGPSSALRLLPSISRTHCPSSVDTAPVCALDPLPAQSTVSARTLDTHYLSIDVRALNFTSLALSPSQAVTGMMDGSRHRTACVRQSYLHFVGFSSVSISPALSQRHKQGYVAKDLE